MDNPRKLAIASLVKAELSSTYSNIEINTVISRSKMSKIDTALYTALYLGVTEKLITLDYLISKYSQKPIEELDIETKNALRLGFYQLLFMDKIPDYSAVSETVGLCPRRSKGFVNACLRSFIRDDKELVLPDDKWQAISVSTSIPVAIIDIFRQSYGDDSAEKIAGALSRQKKGITLRINTLKIEPTLLRKKLKSRSIPYTHHGFSEDVLFVSAPISDIIDLIEKGYCFVQDVASLACVRALGASANDIMLDACACPGGKTFSSAIDMANKGEIYACDLHSSKLSLITSGAQRLGIEIINVLEQDAKLPRADFIEKFDKVLCDVPCSGLGIISKKPDIKYKSIEQIQNLPAVQLAILKNCSSYVKIGADLVYSTCTLNREENEGVIEHFLRENDSFELADFQMGDIRANGMFTFMPYENECDGFFIAKLKRIK